HRHTETELLEPAVSVAAYLDGELLTEGIDHRGTDTVQTTGNLVATLTELAAGVEDGQHQGDGRDLLDRMLLDRDAAAVVDDPQTAVGQDRDIDGVAVAGHRLVDRIVHDLVDQVVQ